MAIGVVKLTLGALSTNCFLVYDKSGRQGIIVDPSDSGEFITKELTEKEIIPIAIVATHGHFDHILAGTHLALTLKIPFEMNKKDEFLLDKMQDSSFRFTGNAEDVPPKIGRSLKNGDKIVLGQSSLEVLETPGHTPGSISLYSKEDNLCFSGDLVFSDGSIGRYDFSYSEKDKLLKSVDKILKLPARTKLFCGHGEDTSVSLLRVLLKNRKFV